jgi:hypothetical protein
MTLNVDDLTVDTFEVETAQYSQPVIVLTVLYETEQISCGGTCQTCDCWA